MIEKIHEKLETPQDKNLTMPHYWMNHLEEAVSETTAEGIKLPHYGIGAKVFLLLKNPRIKKFLGFY